MGACTRASFSGVVCAVLAVAASCPALAQVARSGRPIPSGPDAKTNAAFREGFYQYYLQLAEAYRQHTSDSAELQPLGVELFTTVARKRALEPPTSDISDLRRLSQLLVDKGSRDPLVLQRHARLETIAGEFDAALARLLECEKALQDSEYPPLVALLNSFYLCSLARAKLDEPLLEEHFPEFVRRLSDWVAQETKNPDNVRYVLMLAHDISKDFPNTRWKTRILTAVTSREDADRWFLDTFEGAVRIDIAWLWRGGFTADQVTQEGWKKLGEHLELARQRLLSAWKAQPTYPEPASHMIGVAMLGGDSKSPREWFDQAVTAEMDHPLAYEKLVVSLLPRWGGSQQAMYRFGLDCLQTQRFDTVVPLQLFFQVMSVEQETGNTGRFWRTPSSYAQLKQMFEGYENAPLPPAEHRDWFSFERTLSLYGAVAVRAEQWSDAARVISKLEGKLTAESMRALQVGAFDAARAFALTGEAKQVVAAVENVAGTNPPDVDSLARAMEQLSEAQMNNTDPYATAYFPARLRLLRETHAFWSGEWAELLFDEDLTGWRRHSGKWTMESERAVIAERDIPGEGMYYVPLELYSMHDFPPPYEMHVQLEELGAPSMTGAGIVVGDVSFDGMRFSQGRLCWAHANAVGIDTGIPDPSQAFSDSPMGMNWSEPRYELDVRVWPRSLLMLVNKKGPYSPPDQPFDPGKRVGLAARHESPANRVRFSNVRIRKLPYGPLMEIDDYSALVAEGKKMVDFDPDDWFARWVRGTTYFSLGQHEQALADLRELQRVYPAHEGMLYYTGAALAAAKQYEEAIATLQKAAAKNPSNHAALRSWAELELTCEDQRFRNPQRALQNARAAHGMAMRFPDYWRYCDTLAMAHAEFGQWQDAIQLAEQAVASAPPESSQAIQQRLSEYREQHRNSLSAAVAALLWEGDMTRRLIGAALTVLLLAANLILISRLARFGLLAGAAAGLIGVGISFTIPLVLAMLLGVGEGPAFVKLSIGIVAVAATCGAIGGAVAGILKQQPAVATEAVD